MNCAADSTAREPNATSASWPPARSPAPSTNVLTAENDELHRQASRSREFTGPRPLAQLGTVEAAGGTRRRLA